MRYLWAALLAALLLWGCAPDAQPLLQIRMAEEPLTFSHFTAEPASEDGQVLAVLQSAMSEYPEDFFDQLGRVEILLVGALTGQQEFTGGHYAGFTQKTADGWLLVLGEGATPGTVHHEIGHILDGILTEAGLLTEGEWKSFCPDGFEYGQHTPEYADFFAEAYAMTNLQEDRAATFEAAIMGGEGAFSDSPALWLKLSCFSRAIREHFDTEGWPPKTIWELALA